MKQFTQSRFCPTEATANTFIAVVKPAGCGHAVKYVCRPPFPRLLRETSLLVLTQASVDIQRYFVAETLLSLRLSLHKNSFPTVVHLQQLRPEFGRHLRLWLSNIVGAKMMIDFEGWDVGYADARNGQPSQCPTNVDPISYLSGYREGCFADRAYTSLSVQMKRGWIR